MESPETAANRARREADANVDRESSGTAANTAREADADIDRESPGTAANTAREADSGVVDRQSPSLSDISTSTVSTLVSGTAPVSPGIDEEEQVKSEQAQEQHAGDRPALGDDSPTVEEAAEPVRTPVEGPEHEQEPDVEEVAKRDDSVPLEGEVSAVTLPTPSQESGSAPQLEYVKIEIYKLGEATVCSSPGPPETKGRLEKSIVTSTQPDLDVGSVSPTTPSRGIKVEPVDRKSDTGMLQPPVILGSSRPPSSETCQISSSVLFPPLRKTSRPPSMDERVDCSSDTSTVKDSLESSDLPSVSSTSSAEVMPTWSIQHYEDAFRLYDVVTDGELQKLSEFLATIYGKKKHSYSFFV